MPARGSSRKMLPFSRKNESLLRLCEPSIPARTPKKLASLAVQRKVVSRFARKFGTRKRLRFSIAFPRRNIQLEVQNAFSTCFRSA